MMAGMLSVAMMLGEEITLRLRVGLWAARAVA